jgi:hypothetical protein
LQPQKVKKKAKKKNKGPVEQVKPPVVQGKTGQPSVIQDCAKTGSNKVPLRHNRIPLVEQPEVAQDKLATLKAVQLGLRDCTLLPLRLEQGSLKAQQNSSG